MTKTKIDAHCHLFNKDILTIRIWLEIIHELEDLVLDKDKEKEGKLIDRIKKTIESIRRIINFIKIGWSDSTTAIYEILQGDYENSQGEKFIVTPLTLDIKYAFAEPGKEFRSFLKQHKDEDDLLREEVKRLIGELETKVMEMGDDARKTYHATSTHLFSKIESDIYHDLMNEVEKLLKSHAELKKHTDKFLETPDNVTKSLQVLKRESSYEVQIKEMMELTNNPEYGQYVIPFFSVDPRRANTPVKAAEFLAEIKESVGKGKSFAGIKLYCPLGYSPTDPFLFGSKDGDGTEDCLYKFCQDNKIPITAHCSDAGFATFAQYAKVTGHIFISESTATEKVVYVENKMIDFGSTILGAKNKKDAIRKRARLLNHPQIWTKVYERYNDIYLNLAHFGGEDIKGDWRPVMNEIIKTYPNAYTDFSCYSDATRLASVKNTYYTPPGSPKDKFMYGSDFYLVMLSITKFSDYIGEFRNAFSDSEFEQLSIHSPRVFMGNVIDDL